MNRAGSTDWTRLRALLSERGYTVHYDAAGRLVIRPAAPPHYEFRLR